MEKMVVNITIHPKPKSLYSDYVLKNWGIKNGLCK